MIKLKRLNTLKLLKVKVLNKVSKEINTLNEEIEKSNILKDDDKTKLMCLSGVKQYPMRVKCATLSWHTLVSAMENDGKEISTEK